MRNDPEGGTLGFDSIAKSANSPRTLIFVEENGKLLDPYPYHQ
jgi:hypothetical protein